MTRLARLDEHDGSLPGTIAEMEKAWAEHPHRLAEADAELLKRLDKQIAVAVLAGPMPDRFVVAAADYERLCDVMGRIPGYDGEMVDGEWVEDLDRPIARNMRMQRQELLEQGVDNILYRGQVFVPEWESTS